VSPGRALAVTRRLLAQFKRDRRTLAILFAVPLIVLGLLDLLIRGGGEAPHVGLVVLDRGALAQQVANALRTSPLVRVKTESADAARQDLDSGSVVGYVVLPENFTAEALTRRQVAPEVHLEGSQPSESTATLAAVQRAIGQVAATFAPRYTPAVTYLHGGPNLDTLDYFGAGYIGLAVFFLVFVVTAVSFLRERTQGTLERLMATPLRRAEIAVGYMLAFMVLATAQSIEILLYSLYVLHVHSAGNAGLVFLFEVLMALAAVNLGIFLSMFARTEFQAVQFIPLVVVPQLLLSGILVPVSGEPGWMQYLSNVLPLTYGVDGVRDVMVKGAGLESGKVVLDLTVVVAFCVLMILAAALTLRRRID